MFFKIALSALGGLLCGLGCYLIADGVGSIIRYESQSLLEQFVRVARSIVGAILIIFGANFLIS